MNKSSISESLDYLSRRILHELKKECSDVDCFDWTDVISVLDEIFDSKKFSFIFIIGELDCIFRVHKSDNDAQTKYLNFLRNLLKERSCRSCLHDRYSVDKEIWLAFGDKYVYRNSHDKSS